MNPGPVLRFNVGSGEMHGRCHDSRIVEPAYARKDIGQEIKGQNDIAESSHEHQFDDGRRIPVLQAEKYQQETRQKMELPARGPDEPYEPAGLIKAGKKC